MSDIPAWWAQGTLLENCNCRLLCSCHVSYRQPADHERCLGFLLPCFEAGFYGEVPLDGLRAVVLVDAPRIMTEPDWTLGLCIDTGADAAQREAVEAILGGRAGSGWAVLAALATRWLETRQLPIAVDAADGGHRIRAGDLLEARLEPTRGADKQGPARLENQHNQVHGPTHFLAWGTARYTAPLDHFSTAETHSLWSRFSWRGP